MRILYGSIYNLHWNKIVTTIIAFIIIILFWMNYHSRGVAQTIINNLLRDHKCIPQDKKKIDRQTTRQTDRHRHKERRGKGVREGGREGGRGRE